MKHIFICVLAVAAIASCKPQKPWSPNDPESGIPNEKHKNTQATSFGVNEQFDADIGDVEAQVFINGKVAANAEAPNVSVEEDFDSRKHLLRANVTVTPPLPESLWSEFEIECGRNFMEKPAVVRVRVMADDKLAGSFSAVLGKKAMRNGVSAKIDLLKPFAGQAPESFLVKIVGDLYLMEPGTDENKLNAETASSQEYSQALRGSIIRVNVARAEDEQPFTTPVDPPALGDAAAAVTPPTPESAPVSNSAPTPVPPSPTQ